MERHDEGIVQRHDARFVRIEQDVKQLELDVSTLKSRMFRCEEGVNNFRDFQKKSLQHQWWMKGAAATILAIISFIGWSVDHAIDKVLPAAKVLIEYYDKTHPDANIPKISHTFPPEQKYPVPTSAGNESRQP